MELIERLPHPGEYLALRRAAGWPIPADHLVIQALQHSLYGCVTQTPEGETVGMGRVTGDGALYLHISDVIVHPDYQRRGIGNMLMKAPLAYTHSVGGQHTQIGLMSSKGREPFYRQLGFDERPNDKMGAGMMMVR